MNTLKNPKILVITPVHHIKGLVDILESCGEITYLEDPTQPEFEKIIDGYDAVFTNPNKTKVFLGASVFEKGHKLKVICTASTGTVHIDKDYAKKKGVAILSLTEERDIINQISSTAEHALALTLAAIRNIPAANSAVLRGEWDYTKYIGRQLNCVTIGVIGFGRLGSMYANYCYALGARVLVYDPFKNVIDVKFNQVEVLKDLLNYSDIISLHVHANKETHGLINKKILEEVKPGVLFVNTSRGEIINEADFIEFLRHNPNTRLATDVINDETKSKANSPLINYAKNSNQIIITPHIGGMTIEAQEIAYCHAANLLLKFFRDK